MKKIPGEFSSSIPGRFYDRIPADIFEGICGKLSECIPGGISYKIYKINLKINHRRFDIGILGEKTWENSRGISKAVTVKSHAILE